MRFLASLHYKSLVSLDTGMSLNALHPDRAFSNGYDFVSMRTPASLALLSTLTTQFFPLLAVIMMVTDYQSNDHTQKQTEDGQLEGESRSSPDSFVSALLIAACD